MPGRKSGNLTGCLKKVLRCNLMTSGSAKVLYQIREKSEEMKIEKVPPYKRDTGLNFITFSHHSLMWEIKRTRLMNNHPAKSFWKSYVTFKVIADKRLPKTEDWIRINLYFLWTCFWYFWKIVGQWRFQQGNITVFLLKVESTCLD